MTKPPQPRPAPPAKPSAPLGRVMWACDWVLNNDELLSAEFHKTRHGKLTPLLVLPLDPASVQGMREKVSKAFWPWSHPDMSAKQNEVVADRILAALNIATPRRTKGKKGWK